MERANGSRGVERGGPQAQLGLVMVSKPPSDSFCLWLNPLGRRQTPLLPPPASCLAPRQSRDAAPCTTRGRSQTPSLQPTPASSAAG